MALWLSSGQEYKPGEGLKRAKKLRKAWLDEKALEWYIKDARSSAARYCWHGDMDIVVADLIDRGIIDDQEVALALLGVPYEKAWKA